MIYELLFAACNRRLVDASEVGSGRNLMGSESIDETRGTLASEPILTQIEQEGRLSLINGELHLRVGFDGDQSVLRVGPQRQQESVLRR